MITKIGRTYFPKKWNKYSIKPMHTGTAYVRDVYITCIVNVAVTFGIRLTLPCNIMCGVYLSCTPYTPYHRNLKLSYVIRWMYITTYRCTFNIVKHVHTPCIFMFYWLCMWLTTGIISGKVFMYMSVENTFSEKKHNRILTHSIFLFYFCCK